MTSGSTPVASGSSVPVCPIRRSRRMRRIRAIPHRGEQALELVEPAVQVGPARLLGGQRLRRLVLTDLQLLLLRGELTHLELRVAKSGFHLAATRRVGLDLDLPLGVGYLRRRSLHCRLVACELRPHAGQVGRQMRDALLLDRQSGERQLQARTDRRLLLHRHAKRMHLRQQRSQRIARAGRLRRRAEGHRPRDGEDAGDDDYVKDSPCLRAHVTPRFVNARNPPSCRSAISAARQCRPAPCSLRRSCARRR
ncbi:MAG: hypothetical protein DMG03_25120 [Acidobacteria bacterium]|nr:MAG: hypothetical protein DMG03_25120 [Acidobacteriota bacterium]